MKTYIVKRWHKTISWETDEKGGTALILASSCFVTMFLDLDASQLCLTFKALNAKFPQWVLYALHKDALHKDTGHSK